LINVGNVSNKQVSFIKNNDISISRDPQNFKNIKVLQDRLNQIVKEIGGIEKASSIPESVLRSQFKIEKLRKETIEAWSNQPTALKAKLERLDQLNQELTMINQLLKQVSADIKKEPSGLIIPDKEKLITDSLEIISIYNSLPNDKQKSQNIIKNKTLAPAKTLSIKEIKAPIQEINKDNWNYSKLNAEDSNVYAKLKDFLLIGEVKDVLKEQTQAIDTKLAELKEKKGKFIPEVGVKLYSPNDTGRILALETAKLRRSNLSSTIISPGDENLVSPDILAQPSPAGTLFFKIDKRFIPSKVEMQEILRLNKPYKPVLNKLFPEGLNVYMVPGYTNDKYGDIEGGLSIPGHPESGIWLNSYNIQDRYSYTSALENNLANIREVKGFHPSVLQGNADRARALAHEIGHAITYKTLNDEAELNKDNKNDTIVMLSSAEIDLISGWKGLRLGTKLNNIDKSDTRFLSKADKQNLYLFADYEMLAEDIRMALTEKDIPASSAMSGIYDQTKEGEAKKAKVTDYLRKCLLENKTPVEAIADKIKN